MRPTPLCKLFFSLSHRAEPTAALLPSRWDTFSLTIIFSSTGSVSESWQHQCPLVGERRGTGDTGETPVHPPPLAPSPTLPPSPAWGVELVWLWLVTQALKHSTRRTEDLSHRNTTGPVVPPGLTSHQLPPSHAAPTISLLPLWGRLCPPSLLPPLATLDLKALH